MSATTNKHILTAVCLGQAREMPGKEGASGIFKKPVEGVVSVGKLGLEGDFVANRAHLDGYDRAVCVFGGLDYKWWSETLGRELDPGTFGENLCIEGVDTLDMHVGDRLVFPDAELRVESPRTPCATLSARMGAKRIGRTMVQSGHSGFHCSVAKTGSLEAGQQLRIEPAPEPRMRVVDQVKHPWQEKGFKGWLNRFLLNFS